MTGTSWAAVLLACAACYALKLAGWLVPPRVLEHPRGLRVARLLPVALLAALVAVQTAGSGTAVVLDARLAALAVAAGALALRAPFVLVVLLAAATAAALRALGWR